MNYDARIRERLSVLAPLRLELIDESEKHRGHAGWKEGGGTHWQLAIVAAAFDGKPTVARHRMIYQALGDLMDTPIHALSIRALAPGENGA
ncbi:MAG: BolA family protein [Burkholderiales bacterium]